MIPQAALRTGESLHYPLLPEKNQNWTSLIPPLSSGFLYHPHDHKFYSVALYHQLHCLNSLRKYVARGSVSHFSLSSWPALINAHWELGSELRLDREVVTHAGHCLDYLRQAILCHADTTLEPVHDIVVPADPLRNTSQHTDKVAQGWDVLHRCKDWTFVRDALEDNWTTWPPEHRE